MVILKESDTLTLDKRTLVEEGTELKGSLLARGPVLVNGRVEGEIATPHLTVSSSGVVHGKARVTDLRSEGELSGEFEADSIQLSGTVKDNTIIRAKTLEVRLVAPDSKHQVVFGECILEVGEAPVKTDDRASQAAGGRKSKLASLEPAKIES